MADQTIHNRVRFYAKFSLLIIDEFGFDRIERSLCPQAASLWYKIIDARSQRGSTALVTNIDFESWADLPRRRAAGDGAVGSRGGRRDHREVERQILPHASRSRYIRSIMTRQKVHFSHARPASPGNSRWPPFIPRKWLCFNRRRQHVGHSPGSPRAPVELGDNAEQLGRLAKLRTSAGRRPGRRGQTASARPSMATAVDSPDWRQQLRRDG